MTERWGRYEHGAAAWTVGQLRQALEGLPDDTPLGATPASVGPQSAFNAGVDDTWVIIGAHFYSAGRATDRHLTLELDRRRNGESDSD